MFSVQKSPLPDAALLAAYARGGSYTDCYATDVPAVVSFETYVTSFYTTAVFRTERLILKWALARPSTDADACALAAGTADRFAAWDVEARADDQMLLRDLRGRTRSWLMVAPIGSSSAPVTRLYFGSAVVPRSGSPEGLGFPYSTLLGFHKLYSQVLLGAAKARLKKSSSHSA